MADAPRIVRRSEVRRATRYIAIYEVAAKAYVSRLTLARDDDERERIGKQLAHARRQAEFYREVIASALATRRNR